MISLGASRLNVSFVVEKDLDEAVRRLHATFFADVDGRSLRVSAHADLTLESRWSATADGPHDCSTLAPEHGFEVVLRLDEHNNAGGAG